MDADHIENGTFATIDFSWSRPKRFNAWGGLTIELIGEKGVVDVDAFSLFRPGLSHSN